MSGTLREIVPKRSPLRGRIFHVRCIPDDCVEGAAVTGVTVRAVRRNAQETFDILVLEEGFGDLI